MSQPERIDVDRVLSSLKDFQRRSVDYVFDRLYGANPTRRFLLADEVGLGKTLVARGVIARAIEHLRAQGESRIDVVYICSNADIARQNISRLNVTGQKDFQLATRITLLPQTVRELAKNALNFISFTPGTSFNLGHSTGRGDERWLLYWLLSWTWPDLCKGAGAMNVMQGGMSRENFRKWIDDYDPHESIDESLAKGFKEALIKEDLAAAKVGTPTHEARFGELCQRFGWSRKHIPQQDREDRNSFIGEMRSLLAATCIKALEPDLIILDEFQRFKDLLRPDDPAGSLAHHLFTWGDARVLLVSATPYKMYTLSHEAATDDHYKDFVDTLSFLMDNDAKSKDMKQLLAEYGRACARVFPNGLDPLRRVKHEVESRLRPVMCRTEKLAITEDRSGMLREWEGTRPKFTAKHIRSYEEARQIAGALGHSEVIEYWKASPYLLNFMEADQYKLKGSFRDALDKGPAAVAGMLSKSPGSVLDPASWRAYEAVDPRHALLEHLAEQTVGAGWWRLLWVPPSFPCYELSGPFADAGVAEVTKRLVFSSWQVVPRAISVLLSYEAERRMMKGFDPEALNTAEARERRRPLLMFTRSEGRLTGMPVLSLLYPSMALAKLGDPQSIAASATVRRPSLEETLTAVADRLSTALSSLLARAPTSGPEDETWYWAAPILLDRVEDRAGTEAWFSDPAKLGEGWSGATEEMTGWLEHVRQASEVARGTIMPQGRPPDDLVQVLAMIAVAGPGNCALRALVHALENTDLDVHAGIRHAAGRMAWGIRSLFNTPEVIALIRGMNGEEPYWRRVLEYSAGGCLQSVLDEYLHMLVESEGLIDKDANEAAERLAECVGATASLRAQTPGVDWIETSMPDNVSIDNQRVRARFAMRFGDEHGEREEGGIRKDVVRASFNSPFWPFVLATTSIGQEGLDFHPYCHAVVHWNLPSNPVDLEQREGRVHRYKGHAVRKNVARLAQTSGIRLATDANPWQTLFAHAENHAARKSDISPYWVFPIEGGAVIERHTPSLPLSREASRLPALRRSLAVYRMVFGQPRQDDIVEHLKQTVPESEMSGLAQELSIDLEPKRQATVADGNSEQRTT